MEIHNQEEEAMVMAGSRHIFKGKRTKRQRSVSSFVLTMATAATSSCSSGPEFSYGGGGGGGGVFLDVNYTPSPSDSGELAQSSVEEEDMANCLILLAQGRNSNSQQKQMISSSISQQPGIIISRPPSAAADVYQCKTCDRCFPSFQALGGHRASHKKPKVTPEEKKQAAMLIGNGSHESSSSTSTTVRLIAQQEDTSLSLQIPGRTDSCNIITTSNSNHQNNNNNNNNNNKSRVHECSICGAEFSSGQALGGHMRRHRPLPSTTMVSSGTNFEDSHHHHHHHQEVKKQRTLLSLDLNLPASSEPEEGGGEEEDCKNLNAAVFLSGTWEPLSTEEHTEKGGREMAVPGRRNGMMSDDEEDGALFGGDVEFVEAGSDSDTPPHLRELAAAAQLGNVDQLRSALDNLDGSIDEAVEDGDTALHLTCLYGHLPCVQLLLERGASLEVKDEDGAIPLHDACAGGFTDIVQLLLSSASGPEAVKRMLESVDVEGDTPLHHAARGEHPAVVRLLLAYGASPTMTNIYGKVPSELADPDTEAKSILEEAVSSLTSS
ncbi:OLC1v1034454C1 [Oldenlandia corymbosa var. corymbosa]|uniref:OLC1v1034454C1 n=1 Tax=Oldenlandia corymbosa var. corymbosa TaxID=529605 RepID=A0AAV1CQS1_OLDCO|nr:OLC1v1034454C1 [Oldenlandia corymbosa var. corymbosa]